MVHLVNYINSVKKCLGRHRTRSGVVLSGKQTVLAKRYYDKELNGLIDAVGGYCI